MPNKPKTFQIVIMVIFVALLFLGFLGFSGKLPFLSHSGNVVNYGNVTLWGTIPSAAMQDLLSNNFSNKQAGVTITYVAKKPDTINSDFIEALANGKGPDAIIVAQDEILKNINKFTIIPYQNFPQRTYLDTFLPEAEMFLRSDGIVALPFTIDPIVMYWNKDILTSALVVSPPAFWSDFYSLVPKITVHDSGGNITKSLVSFGEYVNVTHAKEIVSLLMMQAGSPIVLNTNGVYTSALSSGGTATAESPIITAMRFYTEFSKPEKDSYSWNRSLPASLSMFEAGGLALYFGYASEYQTIKEKNPHLNFDVAMVPQVSKDSSKLTFGKIQGIAITAASHNQAGAFRAASLLSGAIAIGSISNSLGAPPVRRDLIAAGPPDAVSTVFYNSALISRGWYDPAPAATDSMFMNMFDSVTSGRSSMSEALQNAGDTLTSLLRSL